MDRLVEWWPLSEQSGLRRGIHSGLDLTDNNSVTGADGVGSLASQFTAANSEYLSRTSEAALQTGDIDYTIAAWVYVQTAGVFLPLVTKDGVSGNREYSLNVVGSPNTFRFYAGNGGTGVIGQAIDATVIATDTWYFLVGWHDVTANQVGISLNTATPVTAATSGAAGAGTARFLIGADDRASSVPYHNGRVQRVGFWKRMLTADERAYLYNGGRGRDYPFN